jgi:putative ATPase
MRPQTLQEVVGQVHLLNQESLLRRMLERGRITSCIFYGPPSSGKTTLATVITATLNARFVQLNAVLDGVKELKTAVVQAQEWEKMHRQRTVLFVDEIHRWNRSQQDALLPHVESGLLTLIGATTENPFYALVGPLLSRCQMFELFAPSLEDIKTMLNRAVTDKERGYGKMALSVEDEAVGYIAAQCGGDIRSALNALEMCVLAAPLSEQGEIAVTESDAKQAMRKRKFLFDKTGDEHYHYASAFIKSLRGSDPDAALYWLAAMVESGEEPAFVFRRLLIFCSEDIGLADPHALPLVHAAHESFLKTGMPEGWYFLGHACVYCAMAPKSNSTGAVFSAIAEIQEKGVGPVPPYLRDKTASGLKAKFTGSPDFSKDYQYPHAFPGHWVSQRYLPDGVQGGWFTPGTLGWEKRLSEIQDLMRKSAR